MELLIAVVIVVAVAAWVTVPLRRSAAEAAADSRVEDPRVAELEARKQAKYREIRDTELDHAAGKLSEQDFRRQEAELRSEAVAILRKLDQARGDRSG